MSLHLKVEHIVLRALGGRPARKGEKWLLAVSGGVDSMAMAEILYRWRRYLGVELAVAHVHHGLGSSQKQNSFRLRAQTCVADWAQRAGVEFLSNPPLAAELESEEELRDFRRQHLADWRRRGNFDRVLFAHHRDDLLETRMLRLIRGCGPQGLRSMAVARGRILRPLLNLSREEILAYAKFRKLKWVEDPTNRRDVTLRNWLRRTWLPQLEKRVPGAPAGLARSLTALSGDKFTETIGPFVGLRRAALENFPASQHQDIVARYLRSVGVKGYSQTHVQELLKRLHNRHKALRFEMLGFSFQASPDFLWASRV